MDRKDILLQHISKAQRGIEIAPYFNPLVPKAENYDVLVLDVFDHARLLENASIDPNITPEMAQRIEPVDFVGSATRIEELVEQKAQLGTFDYIVSSHNFEHLPDPIRFLQGCSKVLHPGGRLIMAIPDKRVCFDYFRQVTTLVDWLEAYHERREKPGRRELFDFYAHFAQPGAFNLKLDPSELVVDRPLKKFYATFYGETSRSNEYVDAHCSTFTPSSFELLIRECHLLGLTRFEIDGISATTGCEFYVELVNSGEFVEDAVTFSRRRLELLHKTADECSENSRLGYAARKLSEERQAAGLTPFFKRLMGARH